MRRKSMTPLVLTLGLAGILGGVAAPVALPGRAGTALAQEAGAPANDAELAFPVTLPKKTVGVKIKYPSAEKAWATVVRGVLEKGLPALCHAADFDIARADLEVRFAAGTQETGGYEAAITPDALYVRKTGARGGVHGHWILAACARMLSEQVVKPEWAKAGLAHLYVQEALKTLPRIYDARAYRDEILDEIQKADDTPLDQWTPAPPGAGAPPEQAVPLPQAAKAFGFLYAIYHGPKSPALLKASRHVALGEEGLAKGPVATAEWIAAVSKVAGEDMKASFAGWAIPADPGNGLTPKLAKTDLLDSDADGLMNFEEDLKKTDKANKDTDADGVQDGEEVEYGTDPTQKDEKRPRVKVDGDGKEWLKLKKFSFQDPDNDAKKDGPMPTPGAELKVLKVSVDDRFLYVLLEADSFGNPDIAYQIALDVGDDGVAMDSKDLADQKKVEWNFVIGFRPENPFPWLGETHNQKDWGWAEWKNDRGFQLATKDTIAEVRAPLKALGLPQKFQIMCYATAKDGSFKTDSIVRQMLDMEKIKH